MRSSSSTNRSSEPAARELRVRWLGRVAYGEASRLQEQLVLARRRGDCPDCLLLLEHPPVITHGRRSDPRHVLADPAELARRGIEQAAAGRGGDVTYHGPGQLVGYPILALPPGRRDAHRYLRDLEEVMIRTAADYDVLAERRAGLTGVWVGTSKLAAIGVRLNTGWITSHGFALNVHTDLAMFSTIVPCGLAGCRVSSLSVLAGRPIPLQEVAGRLSRHFTGVFGFAA
jgi:lipoate-protein ligase B